MSASDHLSPSQFTDQFRPGDYAATWEEVAQSRAFNEPSEGWPRTHAGTMPALMESVREHGVREPVEVDADGYVTEGHHRVLAAVAADRPIPWRRAL